MSEAVLGEYLKEIEDLYKRGNATEHSYRGALERMLPRIVTDIKAVNEPKRVKCGAPDYVILRSEGSNSFRKDKQITSNFYLNRCTIQSCQVGIATSKEGKKRLKQGPQLAMFDENGELEKS
ncbi:MAG: hypothetical protein M3Z24_00075 [Chloroflexota bacterium]|nr:hypothetical protein [Chloroflexota bacterium]